MSNLSCCRRVRRGSTHELSRYEGVVQRGGRRSSNVYKRAQIFILMGVAFVVISSMERKRAKIFEHNEMSEISSRDSWSTSMDRRIFKVFDTRFCHREPYQTNINGSLFHRDELSYPIPDSVSSGEIELNYARTCPAAGIQIVESRWSRDGDAWSSERIQTRRPWVYDVSAPFQIIRASRRISIWLIVIFGRDLEQIAACLQSTLKALQSNRAIGWRLLTIVDRKSVNTSRFNSMREKWDELQPDVLFLHQSWAEVTFSELIRSLDALAGRSQLKEDQLRSAGTVILQDTVRIGPRALERCSHFSEQGQIWIPVPFQVYYAHKLNLADDDGQWIPLDRTRSILVACGAVVAINHSTAINNATIETYADDVFRTEAGEPIARGRPEWFLQRSDWLQRLYSPPLLSSAIDQPSIFLRQNLTIIIKTFGRPHLVQRLVASLRAMRYYSRTPIVIADDGNGTLEQWSWVQSDPQVSLLTLPFDTGLAGGRNALIRHVSSEYVALLDDDFVADHRTKLYKLVQALIHWRLELVGAAVSDRTNLCLSMHVVQPRPAITPKKFLLLVENSTHHCDSLSDHKLGEIYKLCDGRIQLCDMVANFFVARVEALRQVKWDPAFKLGEHEDFFLRFRAAFPQKVGFCPTVSIRHEQETTGRSEYNAYRSRSEHFILQAMKKHHLSGLGYVMHNGHARSIGNISKRDVIRSLNSLIDIPYPQLPVGLKIFVYELPIELSFGYIHQHSTRTIHFASQFGLEEDELSCTKGSFSTEWWFLQTLKKSRYVTQDPSVADLFFIPAPAACHLYHHLASEGWADQLQKSIEYHNKVKNWLQQQSPWQLSRGADHVMVFSTPLGRLVAGNGFEHVIGLNTAHVQGDRFDKWSDLQVPNNVMLFPDEDNHIWQSKDILKSSRTKVVIATEGTEFAMKVREAYQDQADWNIVVLPDHSSIRGERFIVPRRSFARRIVKLIRQSTFCFIDAADEDPLTIEVLSAGCIPVLVGDTLRSQCRGSLESIIDYSQVCICTIPQLMNQAVEELTDAMISAMQDAIRGILPQLLLGDPDRQAWEESGPFFSIIKYLQSRMHLDTILYDL